MCRICGKPSYIQCNCTQPEPFCDQCENDDRCREILDSACVIYHYDTDKPTKLVNLHLPNGTSVEAILEAIDGLIGRQFQTSFTPVDTLTVKWTAGGLYGHSPSANVPISEQSGNTIVVKNDGLYAPGDTFKVKIDDTDVPGFLENKLVGGTDRIVSISTNKVVVGSKNLIEIDPKLDVGALLRYINTYFRGQFCDMVNECTTVPPSGDTGVCPPPTITSSIVEVVGGTVTLTVMFDPASPAPADDYTIYYRKKGSSGAYAFQAVSSSPVVISGLSISDYEGYMVSDCGLNISVPVPFETSSLTVHIVNALPGVSFDDVLNISGFTFGAPMGTGNERFGTHTINGSTAITCDLSGIAVAHGTLKLFKNGVMLQCIDISNPVSPANSFFSFSFVPTDFILVSLEQGTC